MARQPFDLRKLDHPGRLEMRPIGGLAEQLGLISSDLADEILELDAVTLLPPSHWRPELSLEDLERTGRPDISWTLVLSGGGAKGAFQVGAMQQLQRLGYWPRAIAATSVGAVNALALAERSWAGVEKLAQLWLNLDSPLDMYGAEPWLRQGDELEELDLKLRQKALGGEPRSLAYDPEASATSGDIRREIDSAYNEISNAFLLSYVPLVHFFTSAFAIDALDDVRDELRTLNTLLSRDAKGLFNFGPLERLMSANVDAEAIAEAGTLLRLVMVSLESQRVCAVHESGAVTTYSWSSRQLRRFPTPMLLSLGPTSGRMLIEAALASASIPVINPPRELSDGSVSQHMVDGGVRQVLPVDQGLELLEALTSGSPRKGLLAVGAGPVHARTSRLPELRHPFRLEEYQFVTIAARSLETAIDEINTDELAQIGQLDDDIDRLVVMPSLAVGGATQLDPGLIQIQMSYGWMRAFDAAVVASRGRGDIDYAVFYWWSSEWLTELRLTCWVLERTARSFAHEYRDYILAETADLPIDPTLARLREWVRGWPAPEAFPFDARVGTNRFGGADHQDLVDRIVELKHQIARAVQTRVAWHGLDSLPSVHELSNIAAGNENGFADWSTQWERHGLSPMTGYPTGPGLVDPSTGRAQRLGRFTTPFMRQPRFDFAGDDRGRLRVTTRGGGTDPFRSSSFTHSYELGEMLGVRIGRLRFSSPDNASAPPEPWSTRDPDYQIVRHEGFVPRDDPGLDGHPSRPLYQAYKPGADNLTSSRPREELETSFFYDEYTRVTPQGFVFDPLEPDYDRPGGRRPPPGTVPIWTFYSPTRDDHLTTCDAARFGLEDRRTAPRDTIPPDYEFERVEGYVFPPDEPAPPDTQPLYRWVSFGRGDHVTTGHPSWVPTIDGEAVTNRRPHPDD